MNVPAPGGRYLVLEGGDGCGKSSQAERLCDWLRDRGRVVRHVREPGSTPLADSLRELLLRDSGRDIEPITEALLFSAARRELLQREIVPALDRGECVVAERSFVSTIVYQTLAPLDADDRLQWTDVVEMTRTVHGSTWPDLLVILDVPVAIGRSRREARSGAADRIEGRGDAFAERVRAGFLEVARSDRLRALLGADAGVHVVDASGSVDAVHERLCALVLDAWPEVGR